VQKLSLVSLTWELMQFRLPFADCAIPCFKLRDAEVYLVVSKTLCSLTAFEVRPIKTLTEASRFGMERVTTAEALSTALLVQD
jgi:hypothetical protein